MSQLPSIQNAKVIIFLLWLFCRHLSSNIVFLMHTYDNCFPWIRKIITRSEEYFLWLHGMLDQCCIFLCAENPSELQYNLVSKDEISSKFLFQKSIMMTVMLFKQHAVSDIWSSSTYGHALTPGGQCVPENVVFYIGWGETKKKPLQFTSNMLIYT